MTIRARSFGLLIALLAVAAIGPLTAQAASAPTAAPPASLDAPCAGPLAANTEITEVSVVVPSRVDVLANDCVGLATVERPLTIVSAGQGTYGTVTSDGTTVTYDAKACATGDADGNDFFAYTITDGHTTKTGLAVVHLNRPASSPVTDAPQVGLVANSTIGSTVPLKLSWCGVTPSGAGVKGYRLEQGTNGGSTFPTLVSAATTTTSSTRNATPGTSYAWRVRTTDTQNRIGGFTASLASRVALIQDSSSAVAYSTGWSNASGSKYSGGRERYTSKAGATATINVTNVRAVAIVASKAKGRGSFNIYVDNVKVTASAISERSATAGWRRVLYIRGLTSGAGVTHKVQFRAVGNGRVDLDAFLTLSGKRDQTVTFTTAAPTTATYAGSTYAVAATSTSGLPVTLRVNTGSWDTCSLAAGVVSFHGTGPCRIDATQTGDATWNARTAAQTFTVAPKPLTVSGAITATDRAYDGTTAATVDASLVTLDPGVVAGDVVTLDASGATGTFTPDGNVGSGKTVQVGGLALTGADAAKYTVTPPTTTASITTADLTVSFVAAGRPYDGTTDASITSCSVATVFAGDVVTCDHTGATASFADANVGAGKTVTGSGFALAGVDAANYAIDAVNTTTAGITKATQTVAFTSTAPSGADPGDTYDPTATATSGLAVTITVDPSAAAVCHITAGEVTMDATGVCVLAANQPGDANHQAALEVQQSFAVGVGPLAQTIAFDLSGITATYGDSPIAISATATSGLTVTLASLTPAVCSVQSGDVVIATSGTCTVRASQAGDATWAPAPNVDESFTVAQRAITVTAVTDTKPADGTTASDETPTITAGTLAAGDTGTFTQVFNTATVGTGKTLTPSGTIAHGVADVTSSYAITLVAVTTGVIEVGPADVTTSTVAVMPGSVQNDGVDTVNITVRLFDQFLNPLAASGGTVTVFANHGSVGIVTDQDNGTYTAVYTSDTFSGTVTITAELDGTPIIDNATVNQH